MLGELSPGPLPSCWFSLDSEDQQCLLVPWQGSHRSMGCLPFNSYPLQDTISMVDHKVAGHLTGRRSALWRWHHEAQSLHFPRRGCWLLWFSRGLSKHPCLPPPQLLAQRSAKGYPSQSPTDVKAVTRARETAQQGKGLAVKLANLR